jgi:hypothetical protein
MGSSNQRDRPVGDQDWCDIQPRDRALLRIVLPFVETASRQLEVKPVATAIHDSDRIPQTVEKLAEEPNTGVIVLPSALFTNAREVIITTVARLRLPTVYPFSFFAKSGGLLSYGFAVGDIYRRAAVYVDSILRGTKASDLPAQQPTKFELVVNLKTTKALGLTVPYPLLARADEVIEWRCYLLRCMSPLLAHSGRAGRQPSRQLSGVKQPRLWLDRAAASDPNVWSGRA